MPVTKRHILPSVPPVWPSGRAAGCQSDSPVKGVVYIRAILGLWIRHKKRVQEKFHCLPESDTLSMSEEWSRWAGKMTAGVGYHKLPSFNF